MRYEDVKKELRENRGRLLTGALLLLLGAALAVLVLHFDAVLRGARAVLSALKPALYGLVIAFVINLFVKIYEDHVFNLIDKFGGKFWQKIRYPLACGLGYLTVFLILALVIGLIVPGIAESVSLLGKTLQETLPQTLGGAVEWLNNFANRHDLGFLRDLTDRIDWSSVLSRVTEVTSEILGKVFSFTTNLASGVMTLVMGFIFSVYMLFGKKRLLSGIKKSVKAFLPDPAVKKLHHVGSTAYHVFFNFLRGQLTECVILGTLCYIGMRLLGLDYALLISSVVCVTALIPVLGAYIGGAAGVIVLLFVHPIDALIFLIFLILLQQVEGNFIYPRVVGSSIGLPAVWTFLSVLFWGNLLGMAGILLGPPTTSVVYRLFREAVNERLEKKDKLKEDESEEIKEE